MSDTNAGKIRSIGLGREKNSKSRLDFFSPLNAFPETDSKSFLPTSTPLSFFLVELLFASHIRKGLYLFLSLLYRAEPRVAQSTVGSHPFTGIHYEELLNEVDACITRSKKQQQNGRGGNKTVLEILQQQTALSTAF